MNALRPLLLAMAMAAAFTTGAAAENTIETSARQAILIDDATGVVLFSKNSDELMAPSSMSKLMTIYMVFERLAAGTLKMEDTFPVSQKAWRTGGSKMFVHVGDHVRVDDLLRGIIVQSGNDACVVVAEGLAGSVERFAEQSTQKARELGMTKSVFKNPDGLPDPEHVMTARELGIIARDITHKFPQYYELFSEIDFTYGTDLKGKPIKQGNRNPLLYKNIGVDGMKTGHTDAGGYGMVASAKRDGRRLVLVVNGMQSVNERSRESERLLDIGFREYDTYRLFTANTPVEDASVWLGTQNRISMVPEKDVILSLDRRNRPGMKVTLLYDNPVPAPIRKGQPIGRLSFAGPGMESFDVPLVATADVDRLGFTGRIAAAASHLVWGNPKQ